MDASLIQIAEFTPAEVLPYVQATQKGLDPHRVYAGYRVDMTSQRYAVFSKSLTCAICGITGSVFRLEYNSSDTNRKPDKAHLNLYACSPVTGVADLLMTKDHIIPKSKGGKNQLSNYRTACAVCNSTRGNKDI